VLSLVFAAILLVVGFGLIANPASLNPATAIDAEFRAGQSQLEGGKADLKLAVTKHDPALVARAQADFVTAAGHFRRARYLAHNDRLLLTAEMVPPARDYTAPRVRAVDQVTAMALALTEAAQAAAGIDALLVAPEPKGVPASAHLVHVLRGLPPLIDRVDSALARSQADAARVDLAVLPGSAKAAVLQVHATAGKAVAALAEMKALAPSLLELLGGNGPRKYLLEQVNPAELRAGGGFFGSYSILTADQGALTITKTGDIADVIGPRPLAGEAGYVAPPRPLTQLVGDKSWTIADSNFWADFPTDAKAAAPFEQQAFGTKFDGVIAMDPQALADLLAVTGPIKLSGYDPVFTAKNLTEEIFDIEDTFAAVRETQHKKLLGLLGAEIMRRILLLPPNRYDALWGALNSAAQHRRLAVYFNNPGLEAKMDSLGWTGRVNPTQAADFLLETEDNLGGDKANHFVTRSFDLQLTHQGDRLLHNLTVTVTNTTPRCCEGGRTYVAYARLYIPANAANVTVAGLTPGKHRSTETPPAGLQLVDGWFTVYVDSVSPNTISFSLGYDTPWTADAKGAHQLYWEKEPGTVADQFKITWSPDGQNTAVLQKDLGLDRLIELTPQVVWLPPAQVAAAPIPQITF